MAFDFEANKIVDSLDKVPQDFQTFYMESSDGTFALATDLPAVAAAVKVISGLNRSLSVSRKEAKGKTTVDLTPLADFGATPEEIREAVDAKLAEYQSAAKNGEKIKLDLDNVKKEYENKLNAQLQPVVDENRTLRGQLTNVVIKSNAQNAIREAGGDDLLLPFVMEQLVMGEYAGETRAMVRDTNSVEKDAVRLSASTNEPLGIPELLKEMKGQDRFKKLFPSEAPTGSGHTPNVSANVPRRGVAQRRNDMSPTEKIKAGLDAGQAFLSARAQRQHGG
jgi:hypothetical protein